jgi:GST-like protein
MRAPIAFDPQDIVSRWISFERYGGSAARWRQSCFNAAGRRRCGPGMTEGQVAMFTVYGARGSGSVVVEGALTLMGVAYRVVDADPWGDPAALDALERVSPLRQVPVLELPDGRVMTESAAMLLWFGDTREGRPFAPALNDPHRPEYLRWMVYIPANIYPMYTVKDNVASWVSDGDSQVELTANTIDRITACWKVMEAAVAPSPFIFGETPTFLDLYVCVVSRWTPGRDTFAETCPRLADVAARMDADPRLSALWRERF